MSGCSHADVVPVEALTTHFPETVPTIEVVAHLCLGCDTQLPRAWGCVECEWVEVRTLCSWVPSRVLARPCPAHEGD